MKNIMIKKNAQGLPVNIVVMMIIGIIIFGIGFSMFSKFSDKGQEKISDLSNQIKADIANLECNSNEWICSPNNKMKSGETKTFQIFIANNGETSEDFSISLKTDPVDSYFGITNDCGSVIAGIYPDSIKVLSGHSASIPIEIIASRVNKIPCTFVTIATLTSTANGDGATTSVIIRVE